MNWQALRAEFPRDEIEWRAQSVTRNGDKAMALAYIDARAVMDRLDDVCGPENWSDSYAETAKGRVLCTLSIRVGGEWISKTDGSGDSDVEAEKGAISGALKRAAVRWGIGRYLYDMPAPWVPCECYEAGGKKRWKAWKADPWQYVRQEPKAEAPTISAADWRKAAPYPAGASPAEKARIAADGIIKEMREAKTPKGLNGVWGRHEGIIARLADSYPVEHGDVLDVFTSLMSHLEEAA